jgi:hypothetical protein
MCTNLNTTQLGPRATQAGMEAMPLGNCRCCGDRRGELAVRWRQVVLRVVSHVNALSENEVARLAQRTARWLRSPWHKPRPGFLIQPGCAAGTVQGPAIPPVVAEAIVAGGSPLERSVRRFMERRFAEDFGFVRVHRGADAAQAAVALGCPAFTVSNHILFGKDQYDPDHPAGRQLLAHELTHTLQQRKGGRVLPPRLDFGPGHESQAEVAARAVDAPSHTPADVLRVTPLLAAPLSIQTSNGVWARCGSICSFPFAPEGVLLDPRKIDVPCGLVDCGYTSTPGPRATSWCAYQCAGRSYGAFVINTVCGPVGPYFTDQFVN